MNVRMIRWLIVGVAALSACEAKHTVQYSLPVGIQLSVAGAPLEAALAASKPHDPQVVVPKVAELLTASLAMCSETLAQLHAGQVLRFTLVAAQNKIVSAGGTPDAPTACLTHAALGRPLGGADDQTLLIELRERAP